jgi:hypothetical protein
MGMGRQEKGFHQPEDGNRHQQFNEGQAGTQPLTPESSAVHERLLFDVDSC